MVLVLIGFGILRAGSGWATLLDAAFFAVLGAVVSARWYEFRCGDARTSTGERATRQHLRRYTLGAALLGGLAWVAVNAVGNS
jgi:hypothetical protein